MCRCRQHLACLCLCTFLLSILCTASLDNGISFSLREPCPMPALRALSGANGQEKVELLTSLLAGRGCKGLVCLRGGGKASGISPLRRVGGQVAGFNASSSIPEAVGMSNPGSVPSAAVDESVDLADLERFRRRMLRDEVVGQDEQEGEGSGGSGGGIEMSEGLDDALAEHRKEVLEEGPGRRRKLPDIERLAREAVVNRTEMREIEEDLRKIREEREAEERDLKAMEGEDGELDTMYDKIDSYIRQRTRVNASGYREVIPLEETGEGAELPWWDLSGIAAAMQLQGRQAEAEALLREQGALQELLKKQDELAEDDLAACDGPDVVSTLDLELEEELDGVFGADRHQAIAFTQKSETWAARSRILARQLAQEHPLEVELWHAARVGNASAVQRLLELGADPSFGDPLTGNWTAMHIAAAAGHASCIRELVRGGGDVNASDALRGISPLHEASMGGHVGAVRRLVAHGAWVDAPCDQGIMPLEYAYAGSIMMPEGRSRPEDSFLRLSKGQKQGDTVLDEIEGGVKEGEHGEVVKFLGTECRAKGTMRPSDYAGFLEEEEEEEEEKKEEEEEEKERGEGGGEATDVIRRGFGEEGDERRAGGGRAKEMAYRETLDLEEEEETREHQRMVRAAEGALDSIWAEEFAKGEEYFIKKFGVPFKQDLAK